jgi:hypothetical protein
MVIPLHSRAGVKSLVQFALALANVLQQSCLLKRPKFIFTVITPFGKFDSMVDAAKFEGVRVQTLREWVKNSNRSDYEFF